MTTYLIAGGCGFIGSNFAHFLLNDQPETKIIVVDNLGFAGNRANLDGVVDNILLEVEDICDFEAMTRVYQRHQPEVLVNFAA